MALHRTGDNSLSELMSSILMPHLPLVWWSTLRLMSRNGIFYTKYFMLSYSIDLVSTLSHYEEVRPFRVGNLFNLYHIGLTNVKRKFKWKVRLPRHQAHKEINCTMKCFQVLDREVVDNKCKHSFIVSFALSIKSVFYVFFINKQDLC